MYSPPTSPADEQRILAAQTTAAEALEVTVTGPRRWGYAGRSLGQQAHHPRHGACWLRLISAPVGKAHGKLWDGTHLAATAFPDVRRPALHGIHDLVREDAAYRAELCELVTSRVCSPDPVLRTELALPETWWKSLRTDLDAIAGTPTDRTAVRQEWINRAVPQFTGHPAPIIEQWATAHGDLQWANLTADGPTLLDFEGFGAAPLGYDPALLYVYSLLAPHTAAQIRAHFTVLASEPGRAALLIVAADLLQSCSRGDHPELAEPLRSLTATLA
ncbi:hypothetical protein [Streptomyces aureus]|uniref:hypothetical protein n=1 Tax=Streptomyces aureus TaxID=193461 RepID=UPI000562F091|nr:hypothetical protein [Streptomyces aureus]